MTRHDAITWRTTYAAGTKHYTRTIVEFIEGADITEHSVKFTHTVTMRLKTFRAWCAQQHREKEVVARRVAKWKDRNAL